METKPLRYFSHSRVESDEHCRFKRYLSREWGGTGIVPVTSGWDLVYGNIIHAALDNLAKHGSIDYLAVREQTLAEAGKVFDIIKAREWAMIAEGTLIGFVKHVWPLWMAEYEVDDSEAWINYECESGFVFRARQDLRLRSKIDKHIRYVEYKTTSSNSPDWIASWAKSPQIHTSLYALREAQGVQARDCIVQGLYKGYKDKKKGQQKSVFSYGYVNRMFTTVPHYSYEYERAKGWEPLSVWDEFAADEGGVRSWVETMPTETLSLQFPQTGPIYPREDIAKKWFRQQMIREREVDDALVRLHKSTNLDEIQLLLDTHFRQNFSKCTPSYGFKCEYEPYCWIPYVQEDPLGSGLFTRYEDIDAPKD